MGKLAGRENLGKKVPDRRLSQTASFAREPKSQPMKLEEKCDSEHVLQSFLRSSKGV